MSNPSIKVLVDSNSFKDKAALGAAFKTLQSDLVAYCNAHPLDVGITVDEAVSMQNINTALQNIKGNLGDRNISFWLEISNEERFFKTLNQYKGAIEQLVDSATKNKIRFDLTGIGDDLKRQLTDIFYTLEDREYNIDVHIANKGEFTDELESLADVWREFRGNITDITFDTFEDAESIEKFRNEIRLAGETLDGFLTKLREFRSTYFDIDSNGLTNANLDVSTMGTQMEQALENVRSSMVEYFQGNPLKIPFYIDSRVLAEEFQKAQNAYDNFVDAVNSGKVDETVLGGLEQQITNLRLELGSVVGDMTKVENLASWKAFREEIEKPIHPQIKANFVQESLDGLQTQIDNYTNKHPLKAKVLAKDALTNDIKDALKTIKKETTITFTVKIDPKNETQLKTKLDSYVTILKDFADQTKTLAPLAEFDAYAKSIKTGISGIVSAGKGLSQVPKDISKFKLPSAPVASTSITTTTDDDATMSVDVTPKLDTTKFSGFQTLLDAYFNEKPLQVPVKVDNEKLVQAFNDVETAYQNFITNVSNTEFDATGFERLSDKAAGLVKDLRSSKKEIQNLATPAATTNAAPASEDNPVKATLDTSSLGDMQAQINTYCAANPLTATVTINKELLSKDIAENLAAIKDDTQIPFKIDVDAVNATELETTLKDYREILEQFANDMANPPSLDGFDSYITRIANGISGLAGKVKELKKADLSNTLKTDLEKTEASAEQQSQDEVSAEISVDPKQVIAAVNTAIAETNIDSFEKVKIGVEVTKESVQEAIKNAGLSEITAEVKKALKDAESKTENKIVKRGSKKAEKTEPTKTKAEKPVVEETTVEEKTPVYTKEGNAAKLEQYKKQLQEIKNLLASTDPDDKLIDNTALANLETAKKSLEDLVAQYNRLRNVDKRGALLDGDMASASGKLNNELTNFENANTKLEEMNNHNTKMVESFNDARNSAKEYQLTLQDIPDEVVPKKQLDNLDSATKKFDQAVEKYEKLTSVREQSEAVAGNGAVGTAAAEIEVAQKALSDAVKESMGKYKKMSTDTFVTNLDKEVTSIQKKMASLDLQLNDNDFQKKLADEHVDVERIRNLYNQVLEIRQKIATTTDTNQRERLVNAEKVILTTLQREFTVVSNVRAAYSGQVKEQDKIYTSMTKLNTFVEKYKDELSKIPYLWERINKVQNEGSTWDSTVLQREIDGIITAAQSFGVQTETMFTRLWARIKFNVRSGLAGWGTMLVSTSFRELYNNVKDLDAAMTELRKVTDETEATYTKFLENAADRAQKLGASLTDVVNSTSDFARLGSIRSPFVITQR